MTQEETQMLRAAKNGDLSVISQLLAQQPSLLNVLDADGSTPLHCAAWKGHVDVARILIDAGADLQAENQNDHWGTTPLHAAAHGNRREVAELLIERGADLNAKNPSGRTPLAETAVHNATPVAKLLRQHGAIE